MPLVHSNEPLPIACNVVETIRILLINWHYKFASVHVISGVIMTIGTQQKINC